MPGPLSQLVEISKAVGADSTLVQGGGGNTSVKTADAKFMYIKASGTALKEMDRKTGWRRLRLDAVREIMDDKSIARLDTTKREIEVVKRLLLACDDKITVLARPSIEAHLHAFLDSCVIHLHPSTVGAFVNAKDGNAHLARLFKDENLPPLWVPYASPGFMLAKKVVKLVTNYKDEFNKTPNILFLQKHGLIISARGPRAALTLLRKVINRCNSKLKQPKTVKLKPVPQKIITDTKRYIRGAFRQATGRGLPVSYYYDERIGAFLAEKNAPKLLATAALTPDELLYAGGPAVWVEKCVAEKIADKLTAKITADERPPRAFLVKDVGLFIVAKPNFAGVVRDITTSSFFIRTNARRLGGITTLNKPQREFINKWEADAFRMLIAAARSIA